MRARVPSSLGRVNLDPEFGTSATIWPRELGTDNVPPRNSTDMAEKLRAAGVSAKAIIVEGVGHGRAHPIVRGAAPSAKAIIVEEGHGWGDKMAKSTEQSVAFFDEHLKK
jgi:hypothetical protein